MDDWKRQLVFEPWRDDEAQFFIKGNKPTVKCRIVEAREADAFAEKAKTDGIERGIRNPEFNALSTL